MWSLIMFQSPPSTKIGPGDTTLQLLADRAGIEKLDVIMEFAGERTRDPGSLQEVVERKPIGSFQDVKIYRDGKEIMLKVELATLEDPTLRKEDPEDKDSSDKDQEAGEDATQE